MNGRSSGFGEEKQLTIDGSDAMLVAL